jgi:hypothetical protein
MTDLRLHVRRLSLSSDLNELTLEDPFKQNSVATKSSEVKARR